MSIGSSIFLIAIGAILRFAVNVDTQGINLHTVGVILMLVGLVGLAISLVWMTRRRRTDVIYREDGATTISDPESYPI